jgi:hypothetical protein
MVSPSSTATIRRPCDTNAAAIHSPPNRASRSPCSTRIVVALRVGQQTQQLASFAVQPGANLSDLHAFLGRPSATRRSALQIGTLIVGCYPRIDHRPARPDRCNRQD